MSKLNRAALVLALASAGLAACGIAPRDRSSDGAAEASLRGMALPRPIRKPDFTLTDTDGRPFDFRAETDGYLTLLFFGYTHCPDVCPVHMANLAAVIAGLPRPMQHRIKVVFVTVDPERDTPGRIREWLDAFDPRFIGLRGSREAVDSILTALQLPTAVLGEPDATGAYTVGHPSTIVAFTADGVARALYPFGTRQADWAYDLPRLLEVEPAIRVSRAYAAVPAAGDRTALYFTVENHGDVADTLLSVAVDAAGRTELHRQVADGGLTRMEAVDAVPLPAGGRVSLAPGGVHAMLLGLERPLGAGDTLRVELRFRRAGAVRARAEVRPYAELESLLAGAAAPAGGGGN
ncbi:MAG TPA: SCO family protein [Longimicrobiales bacterium]